MNVNSLPLDVINGKVLEPLLKTKIVLNQPIVQKVKQAIHVETQRTGTATLTFFALTVETAARILSKRMIDASQDHWRWMLLFNKVKSGL